MIVEWKTMYLKRSSFSDIGQCDEYFHAEIRFVFLHNWVSLQPL